MPVFNYKCNNCGHDFDLLLGVGDKKEELVCTNCKSEDIQRHYSSFKFNANVREKGQCSSGGCCSCG